MATLSQRRKRAISIETLLVSHKPPISTLSDFIPSKEGKSKDRDTLVNVMKTQIGNIILSSDTKDSSGEESKLQKQSCITILYKGKWNTLMICLNDILMQFPRDKQKPEDVQLLDIIADMCKYGIKYEESIMQSILEPYKKYLHEHAHLQLPRIVVIQATPPGKSIRNCVEYINSKLYPHISGKDLITLFPGQMQTKIKSTIIITLLNVLENKDRYAISQNLKGWLETNPDSEIFKLLAKSGYKPCHIPYYKSICLCSSCKFTVSDFEIDIWLGSEHKTSFRNKSKTYLLKDKPIKGTLLNIAKQYLYIECECSNHIPISSIIPKYLDMSKDDKDDERYKISPKAKTHLYEIIENLTKSTLLKQYPKELDCYACCNTKEYKFMHTNKYCLHLPCICIDCKSQLFINGIAKIGSFYVNSNYQCVQCLKFEDTGNKHIDNFNKSGGVQPGYIGRFCYECIKPFQAKPTTCSVEQSTNDIPLYCIECTINLAKYNEKIRLTVNCPNKACNNPISRYEGCDVVECPKCTTQFCYGCEYIFINPPNFDWAWTCSCIIDSLHNFPQQYTDKSNSFCEDNYIDYQKRRGITILRIQRDDSDGDEMPELEQPRLAQPILYDSDGDEMPELEQPRLTQPILYDSDGDEIPGLVPPFFNDSDERPELSPPRQDNDSIENNDISNPHNIIDEEDIHRQIALAMELEEDFTTLQ